jgi:hypothetical protein
MIPANPLDELDAFTEKQYAAFRGIKVSALRNERAPGAKAHRLSKTAAAFPIQKTCSWNGGRGIPTTPALSLRAR